MKVGKPQSKRKTSRLRHRIEKASAAKQRKLRKQAKNNPEWRTRLKKDPGIPNLFPYKEKILQEIEEKKRLKAEENERKKALSRHTQVDDAEGTAEDDDEMEGSGDMAGDSEFEDADDDMAVDDDDSANPMAALLASAQARASQHDGDDESDEMETGGEGDWEGIDDDEPSTSSTRKDSSRKAFDKIFKQVVDAADVVLYVLDARDPEGTRSREVERQIMTSSNDKRLILILNKIDLIPPPVLKGWLVHLRRFFPTLPLRAANPAANARTFDHKKLTVKGTSEALFHALKAYAQAKQLKRAISVGIIGYPNVGKSSVINSLTSRLGARGAACPVGAEAGVTTSLREVKLDNKLKLLDSPGIVFPSSSSDSAKTDKTEEKARLILLNAVPPKDIDDPVPAVKLLLKRLSASPAMLEKLYDVYSLPALMSASNGDISQDFLVQVARKRGRLGKGGVPNLHSAAQCVITDWRDGRIQGWIDPPTMETTSDGKLADVAPEGDQKVIVTEWAKEFKLWGDEEAEEETMQS